jgi:hypothetical protein
LEFVFESDNLPSISVIRIVDMSVKEDFQLPQLAQFVDAHLLLPLLDFAEHRQVMTLYLSLSFSHEVDPTSTHHTDENGEKSDFFDQILLTRRVSSAVRVGGRCACVASPRAFAHASLRRSARRLARRRRLRRGQSAANGVCGGADCAADRMCAAARCARRCVAH